MSNKETKGKKRRKSRHEFGERTSEGLEGVAGKMRGIPGINTAYQYMELLQNM